MSTEQPSLTKEQILVSTRKALGEAPSYTALDVLQEVAERVGISQEQFFQLVEGRGGEVPAEFDEAAKATLDRATQQMSRALRYVEDHRALILALDEVEASHGGQPTALEAVRQLRQILVSEIKRGATGVGELLKADASERAHLQAHATEGGIHALSESLDKNRIGTQLDTSTTMARGHYETLTAAFRETPREFAENVYPHVAVEKYKSHDNPPAFVRYVQLESAKAVALAGRFLNGERSAMRITGSEYDVIVDAVRQFDPKVAQAATRLVEAGSSAVVTNLERLYAEKAAATVTTISESGTPQDFGDPSSDVRERLKAGIAEVDTIPMLQRGVLQGVLASDTEVIFSVDSLAAQAARLGGDGLYEPIGHNKSHHRDAYLQACLAGYAVGMLGRNDIFENNARLLALRRAYKAVSNPSLKSTLDEVMRSWVSEKPNHRIAVGIVLDDTSLLTPEQTALMERKRAELISFENQARMQEIRDTAYRKPKAAFIGEYKSLGREETAINSAEKADEVRKNGHEAIAQREVSYRTIEMLLTLLESDPGRHPTWKDAEVVMRHIDQGLAHVEDKYGFPEALKAESPLSPVQKDLLVMMRVARIFAGAERGDYWGSIGQINQLHKDRHITPANIIRVHNAVLIATEGVNRAFAKSDTTKTRPPLSFISMMESLMNQTEKTGGYGQEVRVGPFRDVQPRLIGERVGSTTGPYDGNPLYFSGGQSSANQTKIEFYTVEGIGRNPDVRREIERVEVESKASFDAFDEWVDQIQAERYPTRSFAGVADTKVMPNYDRQHDPEKSKEHVAQYDWKFLTQMNRALTPITESLTDTRMAGGLYRTVEQSSTAVKVYLDVVQKLANLEGDIASVSGVFKGGVKKEIAGRAHLAIQSSIASAAEKNLIEPPLNLHDKNALDLYRRSLEQWIHAQTRPVLTVLAGIEKQLADINEPVQQVITARMQNRGVVVPLVEYSQTQYGKTTTALRPYEVPILRLATEREAHGTNSESLRALVREVDRVYTSIPACAVLADALKTDARGYQYGSEAKPERIGVSLSIFMKELGKIDALKELHTAAEAALANINRKVAQLNDFERGRRELQWRLEHEYTHRADSLNSRPDSDKDRVVQQVKDRLPSSIATVLLRKT